MRLQRSRPANWVLTRLRFCASLNTSEQLGLRHRLQLTYTVLQGAGAPSAATPGSGNRQSPAAVQGMLGLLAHHLQCDFGRWRCASWRRAVHKKKYEGAGRNHLLPKDACIPPGHYQLYLPSE
jgi:hypothetical protein